MNLTNLKTISCEIHRKTIQNIKDGAGESFADWTFLDINGNIVKGSQLMGLDGCDIRRKLGWADIACTCPEHNQRFLVEDEETGKPLAGAYYEMRGKSGDFVTGYTDNNGYTEKFHVETEEEVEIKVFYKEYSVQELNLKAPGKHKVIHQETAKTTPKSDTTPVKIKVKLPPHKYELHVSGTREIEGYNDFKMVLKKNGVIVEGYTFIVGRDVTSRDTPYVGHALVSKRIPSRKKPGLGAYQSNIQGAGNKAIHPGRNTHRYITEGCIRMNEGDFTKLFDFLEKENSKEIDKWGYFKHVYIKADPVKTRPNPIFKVPAIGDNQ